jgi:hypothetical protein
LWQALEASWKMTTLTNNVSFFFRQSEKKTNPSMQEYSFYYCHCANICHQNKMHVRSKIFLEQNFAKIWNIKIKWNILSHYFYFTFSGKSSHLKKRNWNFFSLHLESDLFLKLVFSLLRHVLKISYQFNAKSLLGC